MEKLPKSIYRSLPLLRVYLDDLQEIENILKEHFDGKVEVRTKDYKIDSVEELQKLKDTQINHIRFIGGTFDLDVELKPDNGNIYCTQDCPLNRGIVSQIEELLLKRKRRFDINLAKLWWVALIYSLVTLFWFIKSGFSISIKVSLALTGGSILIMTYYYYIWRADNRRHSIVILKHKTESPSFWQRNKDQIWLLLIGGVVGSFLTLLVQLIGRLF